MNFSAAFSASLAITLLIVYAGGVGAMVLEIIKFCDGYGMSCHTCREGDIQSLIDKYHSGYIYVVTTVGGLVSALVVAKLGATKPGEVPLLFSKRSLKTGNYIETINNIVVSFYLLMWACVGLSSLIVGVLIHPQIIPTVSDIGTVWLGLAVSSGYAYFEIDS